MKWWYQILFDWLWFISFLIAESIELKQMLNTQFWLHTIGLLYAFFSALFKMHILFYWQWFVMLKINLSMEVPFSIKIEKELSLKHCCKPFSWVSSADCCRFWETNHNLLVTSCKLCWHDVTLVVSLFININWHEYHSVHTTYSIRLIRLITNKYDINFSHSVSSDCCFQSTPRRWLPSVHKCPSKSQAQRVFQIHTARGVCVHSRTLLQRTVPYFSSRNGNARWYC